MTPHIVISGAPGRRLVERVLRSAGRGAFDVVEGGDPADAVELARTLLSRGEPVALVLDAGTADEGAAEAQREEVDDELRGAAGSTPFRVVMAAPRAERLLFADRDGFQRALGREISDRSAWAARSDPRGMLARLLEGEDVDAGAIGIVERLDDEALTEIARHPAFAEIIDLLVEVAPDAWTRPAPAEDDVVPG